MRTKNPQHEIGHIINLINFLFEHASKREQQEFLVKLCLVNCRSANHGARAREYIASTTKQLKLGPFDLLDMMSDNLQYLINLEAKYDHWVTNLYWLHNEAELVARGIHRLSRAQRLLWKDYVTKEAVETVLNRHVRAGMEQLAHRAEVIFYQIVEAVLSIWNDLPKIVDVENASGQGITHGQRVCRLPIILGQKMTSLT